MSLISDALKKARQDVARQDALRQRTPYAVGTADSPGRRVPFLPLLAGLGVGCVIAGLLLAFAWSTGWGPFAKAAKAAVNVAETAPAAAPPPVTRAGESPAALPVPVPEPTLPAQPQPMPPAAPAPEDRSQPVIEVRPAAPAEPPAVHPAPAAPAPVQEESSPAVTIPSPPAPPAPVRPSAAMPPQGAGGLVDGQTYAGEVPVPGGGTVKLNGIAFSPDRPIAVLDGRVMAPGENIQGFTVVAIEAGRVKLQGFGATVFVSPK